MKKNNWTYILETIYSTLCITWVSAFIGYTILHSEHHDFDVFYYSAKAALRDGAIYTYYGPYKLPYWYFPWLSWFYIPFSFFSPKTAYSLYILISILCAAFSFFILTKRLSINKNIVSKLFMFSMSISLCWLLFRVGQMDFILLMTSVLIIHWIDIGKPGLAGLLVPILLFKPHLFLVFFPISALKGKRGFWISAISATLFLIIVSSIILPDWVLQMQRLFIESGQRTDNNWGFTTLPAILGIQENWSGTANLPIILFLVLIGISVIFSIRKLRTIPVLSMALSASLFSAPRAYAYNLPILIPAIVWVSADLSRPLFLLFWSAIGILPFFFRFSTGTYLIVLIIFIMGFFKARKQLTLAGTLND